MGATLVAGCNVIAGLDHYRSAQGPSDDGGSDVFVADAPIDEGAPDVATCACADPSPVCSHGQCVGVKALSQGPSSGHSCAILTDGRVRCWGANDSGQLGDGTTTPSARPVEVTGLTDAKVVATGDDFSCALTTSGHVFCWGAADHGQLATQSKQSSSVPVEVVFKAGAPTMLAVGGAEACAVIAGVPYCWGNGRTGDIGCPDNATVGVDPTTTPTAVNPALPWTVDHLAVGDNMSCFANDATQTMTCIGGGLDGLGDARYINASLDCQTSASGVEVNQAQPVQLVGAVGELHGSPDVTCATVQSRALCWGDNLQSEILGYTDQQDQKIVVATTIPISPKITDFQSALHVAPGTQHVCAVIALSAPPTIVQCWGAGGSDQLGQGSGPGAEIVQGVSDVIDLAAHADFTCALQKDGRVLCWGHAYDYLAGQDVYYLGSAVKPDQPNPIEVAW